MASIAIIPEERMIRSPTRPNKLRKEETPYQGIKEWNLLEQSFKDIDSLLIFKQPIKKRVFS